MASGNNGPTLWSTTGERSYRYPARTVKLGRIYFSAEPLRLPPGLVPTLPISRAGSYIADAVRVQDCPDDKDNPFGTCGSSLFGGYAMWSTHVSGFVEIRFYPPLNGISHFEISHPGNLVGQDAKMQAPMFYEMPVVENRVLDAFEEITSGDLNLDTGEVTLFGVFCSQLVPRFVPKIRLTIFHDNNLLNLLAFYARLGIISK